MRVNARAKRNQTLFRWVTLTIATIIFAIPLISLAEFSFRFPLTGKVSADAWIALVTDKDGRLELLWEGLTNSLIMCGMTVVIMLLLLLPTMVWTRLRLPKFNRTLEFICLLPLTIPAVVLVVGLAPIYLVIATKILDGNAIWLAFAYVILVLPYAYRALDAGLRAIDIKTLTEAARSFGASWPKVLFRVILPNMGSAVIGACFITIAVVLGEFTFARMLARTNLQTALFEVNLSDGQIAAAVSLIALLGTTVLLVAVEWVAGLRARKRMKEMVN